MALQSLLLGRRSSVTHRQSFPRPCKCYFCSSSESPYWNTYPTCDFAVASHPLGSRVLPLAFAGAKTSAVDLNEGPGVLDSNTGIGTPALASVDHVCNEYLFSYQVYALFSQGA